MSDRPADIAAGQLAREAIALEEAKRDFRSTGMTSGSLESREAADRVLKAAELEHGGRVPISTSGNATLKI